MSTVASFDEPGDWIPRLRKPAQRPAPRPCVSCRKRTTGRSGGQPICKRCFGGEDFPPTMQPGCFDGRRNPVAPVPDAYFPALPEANELANHGFPDDFDGFPDEAFEEPAWAAAGFDSEEEAYHWCLWQAADRELAADPGLTARDLAALIEFTAPSPN